MKISNEVSEILKSYVYVYIDPRNAEPFYIGKGKGNRLFSHLDQQAEGDKVNRITEIRAAGMEPQIDLLRYGLSDAQASLVEAAAIDLIGKAHLTNNVAGYHYRSFGRIALQEIITILTAKPVTVGHKSILITINRLYRSHMTAEELYEATRGVWVIAAKRREKVEFAMAVYQGIVREVYHIHEWLPAGTLEYKTRDISAFLSSTAKWEFEGTVSDDIRDEYVGFSVGKSGQNPIRYVNV